MNNTMALKLGLERCMSCDHRWIDYEGVRGTCYICGSTSISECVSLRDIRDAISALRREDSKYLDTHAKRTIILKQRYREIAELSLSRAQEVYAKVKEHYGRGNVSDKVVDQLIVAFRLFSELGLHKSAASVAYMAAMGYTQRGIDKEIRVVEDLTDLVAARQWFMRLGAKEWEAAINLHIGEKALSTISNDPNLLQMMSQVSLWHFYKARDHFFELRNPKMVERIQFDLERAAQLLTTYTQEVSQIEAAKIGARSTIKHGENVRKGLESFGQSVHDGLRTLGEHIESYGGNIGRALQSSSSAFSANMTNAMYTIAASSKFRGRSLDKRMSEVGQLISTTVREVPEGFFQPVKELGAKFALGTVGGSSQRDLTSEPTVINLAESVMSEVKRSQEGLKHLDEPAIKLTGTLLDTLVSKGITKVVEEVEEQRAGQKS
jgi:hypothetical protein